MTSFTLPGINKQVVSFIMVLSLMLLLTQKVSAGDFASTAPLAPVEKSTPYVATYEIASHDAEAVTYNANSKHIWIYGKQRLQAFQQDGSQVVDRVYPELPSHKNDNATMLAEGEKLWLVIGRVLYQFDGNNGSLIKQRSFSDRIHAIHFDAKLSQILIATDDYVIVLDTSGKEVERIRTRLANIA